MPTALELQLLPLRNRPAQSLHSPAAARLPPSFLFEHGDPAAAELDLESIHSIGLNGLAQLKLSDHHFEAFEETLFSETILRVDRTLQNKAENLALDQSIGLFLKRVAGRFLEKATAKVFEWLIRRFRIHEFNVDAVVECILPYHETQAFVRMVSILHIQPGSRWGFLRGSNKTAVPVGRSTLVQRCIADSSFLEFIITMMRSSTDSGIRNKPLWSFFAALIVEYIAALTEVTSDHVRMLLPIFVHMAGTKQHEDIQSAALISMACLSSRVQFTNDVAAALLFAIAEPRPTDIEHQAVACTISIFQTQASMEGLPSKALDRILRIKNLVNHVETLGASYATDPMLHTFAMIVCRNRYRNLQVVDTVSALLRLGTMSSNGAKALFVAMLSHVIKAGSGGDAVHVIDAVNRFTAAMGVVYSGEFKAAFDRVLEGELDSNTKQMLLTRIAPFAKKSARIKDSSEAFRDRDLGFPSQGRSSFSTDRDATLQRLLRKLTSQKFGHGAGVNTAALVNSGHVDQDLLKKVAEFGDRREVTLAVGSIIQCLPRPPNGTIWWLADEEGQDASYLHQIRSIFAATEAARYADDLCKLLIKVHLRGTLLEFTSSIWVQDVVHASALLQARSCTLAMSYVSVQSESRENRVLDFQILLPSLLLATSSPSKHVRAAALHLLKVIRASYVKLGALGVRTDRESPDVIYGYNVFYGPFTDKVSYLPIDIASKFTATILTHTSEILAEETFLSQNLTHILYEAGGGDVDSDKLIRFLLSHVLASNNVYFRQALLRQLEVVTSPMKLRVLYPLLSENVNVLCKTDGERSPSIQGLLEVSELLLGAYTAEAVAAFSVARHSKYISTFMTILRLGKSIDETQRAMALAAMHRIDDLWLMRLSPNWRHAIFSALLQLASADDNRVSYAAKTLMESARFGSEVYGHELSERLNDLLPSEVSTSKRIRPDTSSRFDDRPVHHLTMLLELVDRRATTLEPIKLIVPLFETLANLINADFAGLRVSVDYLRQLVLSTLSKLIILDGEASMHRLSDARVDTVVQSMRVTDNPQTHNACLELLSTIAKIAPEHLLHTVMPIFTFMASNVVRQDDEYSMHVIQQTIRAVVKPLAEKSRSLVPDSGVFNANLGEVLQTFVDSLDHIPRHRQPKLLMTLVDALGVDTYLPVAIFMAVARSTNAQLVDSESSVASDVSQEGVLLCTALLQSFDPIVQFSCMDKLIQGLKLDRSDVSLHVEDIHTYPATNRTDVTLGVVRVVAKRLNDDTLLRGLISKSGTNTSYKDELVTKVESLISGLLQISASMTETKDSSVSSAVIRKNLQSALMSAVDASSVETLISTIGFALTKGNTEAVYHGILFLRECLPISAKQLSASDAQALLRFTTLLLDFILSHRWTLESFDVRLQEASWLCLVVMSRLLCSQEPSVFLDGVGRLLKSRVLESKLPDSILIASLQFLSTTCRHLGPQILPFLADYLSAGLDLSSASQSSNAACAAMDVLVSALETVPQFVGSHMSKLLLFVMEENVALRGQAKIIAKREHFSAVLARCVPPRVLIPAAHQTIKRGVSLGGGAIVRLIAVIVQSLENMSRSDFIAHYREVAQYLIEASDFRRLRAQHTEGTDIDISLAESAIVAAFEQLVSRLNERMFKPILSKMIDWATTKISSKLGAAGRVAESRMLFLYILVQALLARFKSVVGPYFAPLLPHWTTGLSLYAKGRDIDEMWLRIVSCLRDFLLYDQEDAARHFEVLLGALRDQVAVVAGHDDAEQALIETLGNLGNAVGGSELTALNKRILVMARSDRWEARQLAVRVLTHLWTRLGHDMLAVLPETMPALAELLEDDTELVEREAINLSEKIQDRLGPDENIVDLLQR